MNKYWTLVILLALAACGPRSQDGSRGGRAVIQNKGSDTLVNVAQAWAENYKEINPNVAVAVTGGGSGTGISRHDQRHRGHRQRQPEDEGQGDRDGAGQRHRARGVRRRLRRPGRLPAHGQSRSRASPWPNWPTIYGEDGTIETWDQLSASRFPAATATRSSASAGRTTPGPTSTSRRPCWARSATTSWARATCTAPRTSWTWW